MQQCIIIGQSNVFLYCVYGAWSLLTYNLVKIKLMTVKIAKQKVFSLSLEVYNSIPAGKCTVWRDFTEEDPELLRRRTKINKK